MTGFKLVGLQKKYRGQIILKNLDLEIKSGEFVCVKGPSGSGKSTLLRLIAGLEYPTMGAIQFSDSNHRRAFVFQDANLLAWRNVFENVALPFELDSSLAATEKPNQIRAALQAVDLEKAAEKFPHELSGGMKMRVSLARALVSDPQLLLLDEPFSALDEKTRADLQQQLLELWRIKKFTVIFVTHSLSEAQLLSPKVLTLEDGEIRV